ncbi:MAG: hypothetical protein ACOCX4_09050, partial [Planctomycetota bacterium]
MGAGQPTSLQPRGAKGQAWAVAVAAQILSLLVSVSAGAAEQAGENATPPAPSVVLPMERTTYFVGETVPLAFAGVDGGITLDAAPDGAGETIRLYEGPAQALLLPTAHLAPGLYRLLVNGQETNRIRIVTPIRRSAASLQDELLPELKPRLSREDRRDPATAAAKIRAHREDLRRTLQESGLTACVKMGAVEMGRAGVQDLLAEYGIMVLANPHTRPTSFNPVANDPREIANMSQRMLLTAQANERYPTFGGFCYGWDTTGYGPGMRQGLLIYWGWGDKQADLRHYIAQVNTIRDQLFTEQTGLEPVDEEAYLTYLLSIGRPELAPYIDMPTREWVHEIARHLSPMPEAPRVRLARRIDAYHGFLMTLYDHAYSRYQANLSAVIPGLCNTASVQIDHAPVMHGQYFPTAHASLDFLYQSTWNDQVGGPDYAYQWLFTQGLLDMHRRGRPTWISNAFGTVHHRAEIPGKFVKVAAHGLAYGASGIGFAHEGFSNILGGMNRGSTWPHIRDGAGGADVRAGRDFLDRFAGLAVDGRGDHGVGVLFSKHQLGRQYLAMGFGKPQYRAFVALARLGYTPRFVTEEELAAGAPEDIDALLVVTQSVPLPWRVLAGIDAFVRRGGRVLADANTIAELPGAEPLDLQIPFRVLGKPHNMGSPNLPAGDNDALLYARIHAETAPPLADALGDTGRGVYRSSAGAAARTSLFQIDGGPDALYVVAVNDSHIRSQADWHEVTETLTPTAHMPEGAILYDCTDERRVGPAEAVACDLTRTTARVFAVLPRGTARPDIAVTQTLQAGTDAALAVRFVTEAGDALRAVLPFHLTLQHPDGSSARALYRNTTREGRFSIALPIGANAPAGTWTVTVRSQLDGATAALPIRVDAGEAPRATPLASKVFVRDPGRIAAGFTDGTAAELPLFLPAQRDLLPAAEAVRDALARRGVTVRIQPYLPPSAKAADAVEPVPGLPAPKPLGTYWLAYRETDAMRADNARVDAGETLGRIRRETVNQNDWFSGASGFRAAHPVILLDQVGVEDNPMAERLADYYLLEGDFVPQR